MRAKVLLAMTILIILLLPQVIAEENNVNLTLKASISDTDVGIEKALTSPDYNSVLIVGAEGYVHLISAKNPGDRSLDVELNSGRINDLNDVSWHPRGEAALIAGDLGTALRYEKIDHGITLVNGTGSVVGRNLTVVEWRSAGDYAYFGSEDGEIWRFSEGTGFTSIGNDANSMITDISCQRNYDICVVSTLSDGIGVIGQNHNLTWISGTKTNTWIGVDCADPQLNECMAFASGLRMMPIILNSAEHTKSSKGDIIEYPTLEGDFIGVSRGYDSTSIIHCAPASTIRYNPLDDFAKLQISSQQFVDWDAVVSSRQVVYVWESNYNQGFLLTTNGNLVSYEPTTVEIDNTLMTSIILIAVAVSVPGVIIGLIYMNSPFLQKKYINLRRKLRKSKSSK